MSKVFFITVFFLFSLSSPVHASSKNIPRYDRMKVVSVSTDQKKQELVVKGQNGRTAIVPIQNSLGIAVGDAVIISTVKTPRGINWYVVAKDRSQELLILFGVFMVIVTLFAGWRGLTSLLGLVVSVGIIMYYIVPRVLNGEDPWQVCLVGSIEIALLSLYLAHGFSKKTTLSVISTILTLFVSSLLALLIVSVMKLTGMGAEETMFLKLSEGQVINTQGLLLGGIIIGALGVLDDITTAQTAVIAELREANSMLSTFELFKRGLRIGREHITSLVNTLALAYVGASFPLLLLFSINSAVPVFVALNNELIIEEIVRTFVGSVSLIVAVPVSTYVASLYFGNKT